MPDQTTQQPAGTPPSDTQKTPLEQLEELLSQAPSVAGDTTAAPAPVSAEPSPSQPSLPSAEEIEAQAAQQAIEDEAAALAKLQQIKTEFPEPQAAQSSSDNSASTEDNGFEINQLSHKKI